MPRALVLLATGFEEVEAVTVINLLRRAGVVVDVAALGERIVKGAHDISLTADSVLPRDLASLAAFDLVVLPGGMPGTRHLAEDPRVAALLTAAHAAGKWIGAICAAPSVLGAAGLLAGRRATCFPGFEEQCHGAMLSTDPVVVDERIITSRGVGTAIPFALALVRALQGAAAAESLAAKILANS